jgi:hypothetical protein
MSFVSGGQPGDLVVWCCQNKDCPNHVGPEEAKHSAFSGFVSESYEKAVERSGKYKENIKLARKIEKKEKRRKEDVTRENATQYSVSLF